MKRTILLFILSVLISSTLQAQQTLPYHSYSDFNGNVAAYLEINFDKRSDCYKGKTFGELLRDLEINPIGYEFASSVYWHNNITTVPYIELIFQHTSNGTYSPLKDIYLRISWETHFDIREFENIKQYPRSNWVSQHADFFRNKVIKSIEYNPYIKYLRDKESVTPKERPVQ